SRFIDAISGKTPIEYNGKKLDLIINNNIYSGKYNNKNILINTLNTNESETEVFKDINDILTIATKNTTQ
ncbi:MAG: hypothetical protein K5666_00100, partial [Bacilli bacterium]|nr:hypothetical protein [Bacilli bacterium]